MPLIHIYRAGKHRDSAGVERNITAADLATVAANYNSQTAHEAPLCVGHPESNSPAYGWFGRVLAKGNDLYAETKSILPEMVGACKKGLFKKVSASFYLDGKLRPTNLRHVALLGGAAPAVKGLEQFCFADGTAEPFEELPFTDFGETASPDDLSAPSDNPILAMLQQIWDFLRNSRTSFAEPTKPTKDTTTVTKPTTSDGSTPSDLTVSQEGSPMTKEEKDSYDALAAQVKDLTAKTTQFSEQVTQLTSRATSAETALATANAAIAGAAKAARTAEFTEYVTGLSKEGRIAPKNVATTVARMEREFQAGNTAEFSEAGKVKPLDSYKSELKEQPVIIDFRELALKSDHADSDAAPQTAQEEAQALADKIGKAQDEAKKSGKKISLMEASRRAKASIDGRKGK